MVISNRKATTFKHCPRPFYYYKPSNKQKVQRERFAIKGFLSGLVTRCNQILPSSNLTGLEKDRILLLRDCASENLKYFDGHTAEIIKETKNV